MIEYLPILRVSHDLRDGIEEVLLRSRQEAVGNAELSHHLLIIACASPGCPRLGLGLNLSRRLSPYL